MYGRLRADRERKFAVITTGIEYRSLTKAALQTRLQNKESLSQLALAIVRRCCGLVMRADIPYELRALPMELLGLNLAIPSARPIRLSLSAVCLACAATLWERRSGCLRQRGSPHHGPIPCPQASRFRTTFQVLFCAFFAGVQCFPLIPRLALSWRGGHAAHR